MRRLDQSTPPVLPVKSEDFLVGIAGSIVDFHMLPAHLSEY